MFLIKLKTIGNCIIPDLDNFIIYFGNNQIVDLEEYFPIEKIKDSFRSPDGDLCTLENHNVIERVSSNCIEWKQQQRENRKESARKSEDTNKKKIIDILEELRTMDIAECQKKVDIDFFDNLSILDKIINDESFHKDIREFAKKLMHENLNNKLDEKFILI